MSPPWILRDPRAEQAEAERQNQVFESRRGTNVIAIVVSAVGALSLSIFLLTSMYGKIDAPRGLGDWLVAIFIGWWLLMIAWVFLSAAAFIPTAIMVWAIFGLRSLTRANEPEITKLEFGYAVAASMAGVAIGVLAWAAFGILT